ncbi:putative repeat protein (TIGR01451 family) [Gelidibacter algens]|uniref:Putative repeat protein (TIGR01451 family) n=1 Tax=Gelidibacter algens TaxID=49280 RepID=A0A1A7R1N1_9FLAO|nr:Ig-like domain-containing protein [Gelidibacter algens]OBX25389.1 hypothetical protein A9996_10050 [Gelidibacter algens]RAJ24717.1 putative repeat protein (TIGR01451 family) [Gelidibacter algens]
MKVLTKKMRKGNTRIVNIWVLGLLVLTTTVSTHAQNITNIYTDYGGFWTSGSGNINPVYPDFSHNLIAFTYDGKIYSTGVNNQLLNQFGVTFEAKSYQALPVLNIPISPGGSRFIQLGQMQDGLNNAISILPAPYTAPTRLSKVLTDGIQGLDISSGVTNIKYADGTLVEMEFPFTTIESVSEIGDNIPDILVSQIAQPSSQAIDEVWFEDALGNVVGNKIFINQTNLPVLGRSMNDFFNPDTGASGGSGFVNSQREIRISAFDAVDFGLNASNFDEAKKLIYKLGGSSDPAFLAFSNNFISVLAANDDLVTIGIDTPVIIDVLDNDLIPGGIVISSTEIVAGGEPSHGTVVVNPDQTISYTPDLGFIGLDSFLYKICTESGSCAEAVVTVTVGASDIEVTKVILESNAGVGDQITFVVTVTNNGPYDAVGVRVSDLLPSGYTLNSATTSVGSYSNGSGNWSVGNLALNASEILTIQATIEDTGPYTNTAKASSSTYDPDVTNNTASATPNTVPSATAKAACQSGLHFQSITVDLTGEPGWEIAYTFNGIAYTESNIMSGSFIFNPSERGVFYINTVTDGSGNKVTYSSIPPLYSGIRAFSYPCFIITNPMIPSKVKDN